MGDIRYTLFETGIGWIGVAWRGSGIVATALPEQDAAKTAQSLLAKLTTATRDTPPPWLQEGIERITRHVSGEAQDLSTLPLALDGLPPFRRAVYEHTRRIGPGRTVTYAELARLAGSPGAARAVGRAMATNPFPIIVPCHRVVAAGGRPGGFSAPGGLDTKERLLRLEGATLPGRGGLFDGDGALPWDANVAARELGEADAKLARLIERHGPPRLRVESVSSPWEALAHSIVYQQLHGRAAATIASRVKALFGDSARWPKPLRFLEADDEALRGAGLSSNKIAALRDLATKTADGTLPTMATLRRLDDEEVIERLTVVRGVGRWTVQMMLIFRLGRPDVLAPDDFGLRKGFGRVFLKGDMATKDQLLSRGERWRPWRSLASWYLWRAAEA